LGRRLFQAFSVGHQSHPSLEGELDMAAIYQLADLVLLPSETEGRGLPIPESAAAGVPIVCSRYEPERVYAEVVGEHLPEPERIRVAEFPEDEFGTELLDAVTSLLLRPEQSAERTRHNREAVRARYALDGLERSFAQYLKRLDGISRG
ncbi:MAG: glycosyltransferase, partial [Planctomycetota bacterium]